MEEHTRKSPFPVQWTRSTTLKASIDGRMDWRIEVENENGAPCWWVVLYDWDRNICCQGEFKSEAEAMEWMPAFFELAVSIYDRKDAKYGNCPMVRLCDGQLVQTFL